MANTLLKICNCDHEYQDKKYGYKRRVHNVKSGNKGSGSATCTVCGKEN